MEEEFLRSKDLETVCQWGSEDWWEAPGELSGCVMLGTGVVCEFRSASGLKSHLETVVPGQVGA